MSTTHGLVRINGATRTIIRAVDKDQRWVMSDAFFIIDCLAGRLRINNKPLSTNDIIILAAEGEVISINGIRFKSIVHVVVESNKMVCTGAIDDDKINDYKAYHSINMQAIIEQCVHQMDCSIVDGLTKAKNQRSLKIVKVLLSSSDINTHNTTEWILQSDNHMKIHKRGYAGNSVSTERLSVVVGHNKIMVNGSLMKSSVLYVEQNEGYIQFNEKLYKGGFLVIKDNQKVLLINTVDLEEYIYAVVRSESWPGWPLEVNKVFAISCRSYALSIMNEAERAKRAYHVKDTNAHQRYNLYGEHQNSTVRKAVESTKGLCLTYKDMPILAMFDSCCGGIIPAHTNAFNFTEQTLYLARQYPCTFCKKTALYAWRVSYDITTFEKIIAERALHALPLKKVRAHNVDKAGIVKELVIEGHKKSIKLSTRWLSTVAKDIKSSCFSVERRGEKLVFKGNGLGHLVGLCQWGAWQMVKEGWDYKSILRYYYPSTTLKRLL